MFTAMHPEFPEFKRMIDERIATHQRELESPSLDLADTNFIRGRIAALREILDKATPPAPVVADPGYAQA